MPGSIFGDTPEKYQNPGCPEVNQQLGPGVIHLSGQLYPFQARVETLLIQAVVNFDLASKGQDAQLQAKVFLGPGYLQSPVQRLPGRLIITILYASGPCVAGQQAGLLEGVRRNQVQGSIDELAYTR